MRERNQAQRQLKIAQSNKINDAKFSDHEDKYGNKPNNKRKSTRIIRAGSLVKKNIPSVNKGRNQNIEEDFSHSFIEGKSFVNPNSKKGVVSDKLTSKDGLTMNNLKEAESSILPKNIQNLENNSKMLDFQNKIISSAYVGPYPIVGTDTSITFKGKINQDNDPDDKKNKQQQYVQELNEQIKLRDRIKSEEEQKLIEK